MKIYLVRHAEAVARQEGLEDSVRWLTPKGRKTIQKFALRLKKMQVRPELIITSPLTRAVQTAELIMAAMGKHTALVADLQLAPDETAEQLAELIYRLNKADSIMLVGHEPLLSQTAALLMERELLTGLAKGSCLCLERREKAGKPARFCWYAVPSRKVVCSLKRVIVPSQQSRIQPDPEQHEA